MTSAQHVRQRLADFLYQKSPGVLAMKGDWGAGKSYLWHDLIEDWLERDERIVGCRGYSYVSLFSISSMAELKRAIYVRSRPSGPPQFHLEDRLRKLVSGFVRWLQFGTDIYRGVGLKNTELFAEILEEQGIREMLICLDDFERVKDRLDGSALLGFITNLRDERRCKVVVLYNEAAAEKNEKLSEHLNEYREKVINQEIALKPSPGECWNLVFANTDYASRSRVGEESSSPFAEDKRPIFQIFEDVGLSNIRVLQKTKTALDYFCPHIATVFPKSWPTVSRQIAKLCWLHYCNADKLTLEEAASSDAYAMAYIRDKDTRSAEEKRKYEPVERIGYRNAVCDSAVVEFLKSGFVDWDKEIDVFTIMEASLSRGEVMEQHSSMFNLVSGNFQTTAHDARERILNFVEANAGSLSLSELYHMKQLLEDVGRSTEVDKMVDDRINEYVRGNASQDLNLLGLHTMPKELSDTIRQRWHESVPTKPIKDVVRSMSASDGEGWDSSHVRFLRNYEVKDYIAWLETDADPRLLGRIRKFLDRCDNDARSLKVKARMESALHEIAKRSKLDWDRVYVFLKLPKPEATEVKDVSQ